MSARLHALQLREERGKIADESRKILDKVKAERRSRLTATEQSKFDELHQKETELKGTIDRLERQEKLDAELAQPLDRGQTRGTLTSYHDGFGGEDAAERRQREGAMRQWLRRGIHRMDPESREVMDRLHTEQRAQSAGTDASGGYTIAPDTRLHGQIVEGMKEYGLDEDLFSVVETETGANLPIPTSDDTANEGEQITTENTDVGLAPDIVYGQISLDAYLYSSKQLPVSRVLLQDSAINVEAHVGRLIGNRMGRIKARHMTTGTGAGQPNGIVTASTVGVTAASGTTIAYTELIDLEHSVDPAHRPNARYMFHDDVLLALKKLQDADGRPIWQPGVTAGAPDRINGYEYTINQNMATPAINAKTVLFGNLKKYLVRNVKGFVLDRLDERAAEKYQVIFLGFTRWDADLLDAGTNPIKVLQQSAT